MNPNDYTLLLFVAQHPDITILLAVIGAWMVVESARALGGRR